MRNLGKFLKEKRNKIGLSLREASKRTGVSHTHIRDIEGERSVPSFDMVMKLLDAYGANMGDLLSETGHLPDYLKTENSGKTRHVPIISWVQAGHWCEATEPSGDYEEYVATDSNGAFALRVRGDSMEPEFHEGDIIIVNSALKQEHNDYIVVSNEEGEATFKQLKKYGKTRVLHPLNPKYDDIELNRATEFRVIGVIIEKKKRYR
ncbi:putative HTH-type transcriptional regulator [bacterium BMS3Bbin09]|nr:putative HTH-type transcriptional regulator [bacterium BMS3Bbin09]